MQLNLWRVCFVVLCFFVLLVRELKGPHYFSAKCFVQYLPFNTSTSLQNAMAVALEETGGGAIKAAQLLAHVRGMHQHLTQSEFRYRQSVINGKQNIQFTFTQTHPL